MTELNVNAIAETDENKDLLLNIARDANVWDGSFDDLDVYENSDFGLDDALSGMSPSAIIRMMAYSDYNDNDDWFRFDGYGNIESLSNADLMDEVWDQREELLEWAMENPSHTDVNLDDFETEDND